MQRVRYGKSLKKHPEQLRGGMPWLSSKRVRPTLYKGWHLHGALKLNRILLLRFIIFLIFKLCVCVCICTCVFVQVRTKTSEARKGGQISLELELQVGVSHSIYIWMLGLNSQKWLSWADHCSVTVPKRYACTFPRIYYRHVAWRWKKITSTKAVFDGMPTRELRKWGLTVNAARAW